MRIIENQHSLRVNELFIFGGTGKCLIDSCSVFSLVSATF